MKFNLRKTFHSLIDWGKLLYYKAPIWLRFIFNPLIYFLGYSRNLKVDLWIILGTEIRSGQELGLFFAGSTESKNYWAKLAFGDFPNERYLGRYWLWRVSRIANQTRNNSSLLVTEIYNLFKIFYKKQPIFYVPRWISPEADISAEISSLINNRGLKSDLSRIRKNNLNYELTKEPKKFREFYYKMYVPYTIRTHENRAFVYRYEHMKEEFKNCDLLLLKKEQEYIAGILIYYQANTVRLWSSGIKDGNFDYVIKDRAKGALYYFAVLSLKEKGVKNLNFGFSRAFLNDGALQYKKKWGLFISDTTNRGFLLKPLDTTDAVKHFFVNNPFIFKNRKKLYGAVFVEGQKMVTPEQFKKIYKSFFLAGMHRLYVFKFGDRDCRETEDFVPSELGDKVTLSSFGK